MKPVHGMAAPAACTRVRALGARYETTVAVVCKRKRSRKVGSWLTVCHSLHVAHSRTRSRIAWSVRSRHACGVLCLGSRGEAPRANRRAEPRSLWSYHTNAADHRSTTPPPGSRIRTLAEYAHRKYTPLEAGSSRCERRRHCLECTCSRSHRRTPRRLIAGAHATPRSARRAPRALQAQSLRHGALRSSLTLLPAHQKVVAVLCGVLVGWTSEQARCRPRFRGRCHARSACRRCHPRRASGHCKEGHRLLFRSPRSRAPSRTCRRARHPNRHRRRRRLWTSEKMLRARRAALPLLAMRRALWMVAPGPHS